MLLDAAEQWHIRPGTPSDLPFLRAMLYEAAYWRPDAERPLPDEALADPHVGRYLDGWGRAGDVALIALDAGGAPAGAAWYRHFEPGNAGYGFVAVDIPEVSIGVRPDQRGRGAGDLLLRALIATARRAALPALSLSVERENPAARLYTRLGFVIVTEDAGAWTMLLRLDEPHPSPAVGS